ncbi:MAG: hypothetical protein AVDCRST_MAG11-3392, partial [uncultured Gemmatimonadaceae bacterium]
GRRHPSHSRRPRPAARRAVRLRRRAGGPAARLPDLELPVARRGRGARHRGAHGLRRRPPRLRRERPPVRRRLRHRRAGGVPGPGPHRAARRARDGRRRGPRRGGGAPARRHPPRPGRPPGAREPHRVRRRAGGRRRGAATEHRAVRPARIARDPGRRGASHPGARGERRARRAHAGAARRPVPGAVRRPRRDRSPPCAVAGDPGRRPRRRRLHADRVARARGEGRSGRVHRSRDRTAPGGGDPREPTSAAPGHGTARARRGSRSARRRDPRVLDRRGRRV